jgi:hypothetical protein
VEHSPYISQEMAVYEIAITVVHYLLAVGLASCYSMFSQAFGTMTIGQYNAVQAKHMEYYCNNGLNMESVTVLFVGGVIAEEANVRGVIIVVLNTDVFPKLDQ